jgi:chromosomal replication initiator protein
MIHDLNLCGYSMGVTAPEAPTVEFRPAVTMARIQAVVASHYGLKRRDMISRFREPEISHPRQLAMFLCRDILEKSYPNIGHHFGDRDHTTVMHAVRQVRKRLKQNRRLTRDIKAIRKALAA